jgi:hypothetical protein
MPSFGFARSPTTATTRFASAPQRPRSASSFPTEFLRTRTNIVPSRAMSLSIRKRPMKPVPPVTK